jgi:large subunit ribosomal protein L20
MFRTALRLRTGETIMARVKRGSKRRARRKKMLRRTKGFFLTKSKLYQSAQEAVNRAERFSFRDRRVRKRQFRRLWIQRIGAAARLAGMSYSQLMHGLKAAGVEIDRKMLSDIAVKDAGGFTLLAEQAKAALATKAKA